MEFTVQPGNFMLCLEQDYKRATRSPGVLCGCLWWIADDHLPYATTDPTLWYCCVPLRGECLQASTAVRHVSLPAQNILAALLHRSLECFPCPPHLSLLHGFYLFGCYSQHTNLLTTLAPLLLCPHSHHVGTSILRC